MTESQRPEDQQSSGRAKRCAWCGGRKIGSPACLCDDPKYVLMEKCGECGIWRDVDLMTVDPDETTVCAAGCVA